MKSTYTVALIIAIVLALWLASGQFGAEPDVPESGSSKETTEESLQRVRTQVSQARDYVIQVVVSGRTEAKRTVQVRAETAGRVIELPVEKGAVVNEGDLLCRLSMEDRDIQYEKAKAAVQHAELEHEGMLRLSQDGYQGEVNIAGAKSKLINAKADLKSRALDLANLHIRAPFRGIVESRNVEIGDYVQRGGICARIIDPNPMLLVAHVSERELTGLSVGSSARAKLGSGRIVEGTISFISHAADETTRTYRVDIEMPNEDFALRDGLSADLFLAREAVPAHRVSPAILALSDTGSIGIKIVDANDQVRFVEVNIVSDTEEGVWLSGLPETVRLITVGQELVFHGQTVESVPTDAVTRIN